MSRYRPVKGRCRLCLYEQIRHHGYQHTQCQSERKDSSLHSNSSNIFHWMNPVYQFSFGKSNGFRSRAKNRDYDGIWKKIPVAGSGVVSGVESCPRPPFPYAISPGKNRCTPCLHAIPPGSARHPFAPMFPHPTKTGPAVLPAGPSVWVYSSQLCQMFCTSSSSSMMSMSFSISLTCSSLSSF